MDVGWHTQSHGRCQWRLAPFKRVIFACAILVFLFIAEMRIASFFNSLTTDPSYPRRRARKGFEYHGTLDLTRIIPFDRDRDGAFLDRQRIGERRGRD